MPRPLYEIANEIKQDWPKPYHGAIPYLAAMRSLTSADDVYGTDDARGIVLYFLSNASTWRGPVARRIKQELKQIAGIK